MGYTSPSELFESILAQNGVKCGEMDDPSLLRANPRKAGFVLLEAEAVTLNFDRFPRPSFICSDMHSGRASMGFWIDHPVDTLRFARTREKTLYVDVTKGLSWTAGSSLDYDGELVRNPLHPKWDVQWNLNQPYSLAQLSRLITKDVKRLVKEHNDLFFIGRNQTLFDHLRKIAYRVTKKFRASGGLWQFTEHLYGIGLQRNSMFATPLPDGEVMAISGSIAHWCLSNFDLDGAGDKKFSELQRARVMKRWDGKERATKPWIEMGISRRTYFRRKQCGTHTIIIQEEEGVS